MLVLNDQLKFQKPVIEHGSELDEIILMNLGVMIRFIS